MSDWKEIAEDGEIFYVHNEFGNIHKNISGQFTVLIPKVVKLGKFETLEQAQQVASSNGKALDELLENFNKQLLSLMEEVKK